VITVCGLNTSLDKAAELTDLVPGGVNRVRDVRSYPGGKGLHVALTVAALGEPVRLVGLIDAVHRDTFSPFLSVRGVEFHGVETAGPLRSCLSLRDRDGSRVTEILEPGPETDAETRTEARARFLSLAVDSALAVLSGSLPPGFGEDTYAELVVALREAGVRCLVDASGGLLSQALAARPFLIKPNRDEGEALTGAAIDGPVDAARAARSLVSRGATVVVQSLGAQGAVAATADRGWHARVGADRVANPVGSGDCLLGGVAVGLARGASLEDVLRLGVACGAANATSIETGFLRREDVDALRPRVSLTRV
jgi:tagatose 6-phosphate kinase